MQNKSLTNQHNNFGARSKVIQESIVENFAVNWKVTIRKLSSGCGEGNSSVAEETGDGLNQH